jgi:hypothetical protein
MYSVRLRSAAAFACTALALSVVPASARAFALKHTDSGQLVKWAEASVPYVVDASVGEAVPWGANAVSGALAAWSGIEGAPVLSSAPGPGRVAIDGRNSIVYVPGGFAPAGGALAITLVSFDESTGDIVDTDVVINGQHSFAVLAPGARPGPDGVPVPTDTPGEEGAQSDGASFDLQHVLAHETGHSLGLADVRDQPSALMYAFSMPGDASNRAPRPDDVDGLAEIYGGSAPHAGCGSAAVGGARSRAGDWLAFLALLLGATTIARLRARPVVVRASQLVMRKRGPGRALRWPMCVGLAALAGHSRAARSEPGAVPPVADFVGDVTAVSTRDAGGVLETIVDVAPTACRGGSCADAVPVRAWGGTLGGITQQVGDLPAPRLGDRVAAAFSRAGRESTGVREARLVAFVDRSGGSARAEEP